MAVEITEENFEDLLAYDDIFLDYFNAFLGLPVFPQALYYNRLTGTFVQVEGSDAVAPARHSGDFLPPITPVTPPYGATDMEREQMLEWAGDERLPLFLRTPLFREFKLCKLLLRILEDGSSSARRGSSRLRGYSRQTESYISSFSISADNSANDREFEDSSQWREDDQGTADYAFPRPPSRTRSLPVHLGLGECHLVSSATVPRELETVDVPQVAARDDEATPPRALTRQVTISDPSDPRSVSSKLGDTTDSTQVSESRTKSPNQTAESGEENRGKTPSKSSLKSQGKRYDNQSSKSGTATVGFQEMATCVDYDAIFGEEEPEQAMDAYLTFPNDVISEQQTQLDVVRLEGKHQMSLQQIKEQVIGSFEGMRNFAEFLSDTGGRHLLSFWLDCEFYKDTVEDLDEAELKAIRGVLFRDIQDKHRMNLTEDAKNRISQAVSSLDLNHTPFLRTQYDALRRLRAYWVPRYLLHKERLNELPDLLTETPPTEGALFNREPSSTCFFPSLSLVSSLPVRADDILSLTKTAGWEGVRQGGRRHDDRVKSARPRHPEISQQTTMREKLIIAMMADKAAGGPFRIFLERHQGGALLPQLLFWEAVTEYGQEEDRAADRLLRMCHAWNIFNTFLSKDSPFNIGVPMAECACVQAELLSSRDFVEARLFAGSRDRAVDLLLQAWIRYLKEDLKAFIDCHVRYHESPPDTAEDIEVILHEDRQLIVRRPKRWVKRYPPSTTSERGQRLRTALSLAESEEDVKLRAARREAAREKRRLTEKERRKAVRAARQRLAQAKNNKKNVTFQTSSQSGDEGSDTTSTTTSRQGGSRGQPLGVIEEEQQLPKFIDSVQNKGLMALFRKYLVDQAEKAANHVYNLYLDIDTFSSIPSESRNGRQKRDSQAKSIHQTYLTAGCRRWVPLTEKLQGRLKHDRDRPRTPTLRDIQHHLQPKLQAAFDAFLQSQADEMGLDQKAMAALLKTEFALQGAELSMLGAQKKRSLKPGKPPRQSRASASASATPPSGGHSQEGDGLSLADELANVPPEVLQMAYGPDRAVHAPHPPAAAGGKGAAGGRGGSVPALTPGPGGGAQGQAGTHDDAHAQGTAQPGGVTRNDSSAQRRERSGARTKVDGRAQPSREDKVNFLMALSRASAGRLPLQMLHFYKYLVHHGDDDGYPYLDRDLLFYCEVQKFKDLSHSFSDEEMLRRKVQSILDAYLESSTQPALQVDIPNDLHQRCSRGAQRYLSGKEVQSTIFDEAQVHLFRLLLPYWAGFLQSTGTPYTDSPPLTRKERERLRRLEDLVQWRSPSAQRLALPELPRGTAITAITYSIGDGIKWKEGVGMEEVESVRRESTLTSRQSSLGYPRGRTSLSSQPAPSIGGGGDSSLVGRRPSMDIKV